MLTDQDTQIPIVIFPDFDNSIGYNQRKTRGRRMTQIFRSFNFFTCIDCYYKRIWDTFHNKVSFGKGVGNGP